jgi:GT2 family glycosyltransferase
MILITVGLCVRSLDEVKTETISSIINQDFPKEELELIIVTSKYKDNVGYIDQILGKHLKVRLLNDKGKGLAVARQLVVDNAIGKYILWVDGDVVLSQDFIKRQLDFINKNPRLGVVVGQFRHANLEGRYIANVMSLYWSLQKLIYFGATLCRVEALKDVGGFDKRIKGASEDTDLVFRLILRHWKLAINSDAQFFHKQRETIKDLLKRGVWYGYGGHFIKHKYAGILRIPYRLPPIYFASGLKFSSKAYKKYLEKKAFMIPFITTFFSVGWCIGFILGHLNGYGHSIKYSEVSHDESAYILQKIRVMLK